MTVSPFSSGKAILNTLVRLLPIALYSGSSVSALLFGDFRGTLLFVGFIINDLINIGYNLAANVFTLSASGEDKTTQAYSPVVAPCSYTTEQFGASDAINIFGTGYGNLNRLGWNVPLPKATMYVWSRIPDGYDDFYISMLEDQPL